MARSPKSPKSKPQAAANEAPAAAPAPAPAENYALRILSGLHVGASRPLAEKEMILVGSGEDCDIVLSDPGVAPHHALIGLLGGGFSVRALDAPLRIGGQPLHPGDPAELAKLQRVELGQAALAVGVEDDPAWSSMLPAFDGSRTAPAPKPYMRRLPAVAAFAVLSLMSVAILAAVMPKHETTPEPQESLAQLIPEFGIVDGRATVDANGIPVLSGTVKDAATRDKIRQRLRDENVSASLDLRTGEDIANDVGEVLRAQGFTTRTRWLGKGDVEVSGNFEDGGALERAVKSRAMIEVAGVRRIIPRNYQPIDPFEAVVHKTAKDLEAERLATVGIVEIVRGKEPHVVGSDGSKFAIGDKLPDGSTLIGIGPEYATALDKAGQLQRVQLAPPTPTPEQASAEASGTEVAVGVESKPAPAAVKPASGPTSPASAAKPVTQAEPAKPAASPQPVAPAPQTVAKAKPQTEKRM